MKFIATLFFSLLFISFVFAQKDTDVLATATGKTFTSSILKPEISEAWHHLPATLLKAKKDFLQIHINNVLLEREANARKITTDKLFETEVRNKVSDPPETEIAKIYEINKAALDYKSLAEVRPQIIDFLRRKPEQEAFEKLIASIKAKYKVTSGKDISASNLVSSDILATVGERQITVGDFDKEYKSKLYEIEVGVFDAVEESLEEMIEAELLRAEAAERQIAPEDIIVAEVSDKMKDFSDAERDMLQAVLRKRLFTKYKVKILLKQPEPFRYVVSTDGEPARGKENAPVTVVMFSDFQCSACSAVYPVLKRVMAEYPDKVRFVVRDYPLVQIHKDAFAAAIAANAAHRQGKFFEYKELLYNNQDRLDAESLKKYAAEIGLDMKKFEADLKDEAIAEEIRQDHADGEKLGITGTPTIFVDGVKVITLSARSFRKAIERNIK